MYRNAIHDERLNETYLPVAPLELREEEQQCAMCQHWSFNPNAPLYAVVNGRTLQMGQCRLAGLGNAPYAEVQGPFEAAVLTHAESRCRAFDISDEEVAMRGAA